MCWSAEASLALGVAGVATAGLGHSRGVSTYFTIPLVYFSLMELLQFFSYFSINQCSLESNTALTAISYVHIALQPIFINMVIMASSRSGFASFSRRVRFAVFGVSLLVAAILLLRLIPFAPESLCAPGSTICGESWCTESGQWHLAWSVPQYTWPFPGDGMLYYGFATFVLPLLYGGWRGVLILAASGPVLAYLLSGGNPNEWPAVWCFFSVAVLLIVLAVNFKQFTGLRPRKI